MSHANLIDVCSFCYLSFYVSLLLVNETEKTIIFFSCQEYGVKYIELAGIIKPSIIKKIKSDSTIQMRSTCAIKLLRNKRLMILFLYFMFVLTSKSTSENVQVSIQAKNIFKPYLIKHQLLICVYI